MRSLIRWSICLSLLGCGPDVAPPDRGLSSDVPPDVVAALEAGDPPPVGAQAHAVSEGGTALYSAFVPSTTDEALAAATKYTMQLGCPQKVYAAAGDSYTYLGSTSDGVADGKVFLRLKTGGGSTLWLRSTASLRVTGREIEGDDGKGRAHAVSLSGGVDHTIPIGLRDQLVSWSRDPCK